MTSEAHDQEILIALVNPREGREEEFNAWYTDVHLPEVVELPGFLSAQRYSLPEALVEALPYRYATLYRIEGSSAAAMQRLFTAQFSSESDAIDVENMIFSAFVPLGDPITPR